MLIVDRIKPGERKRKERRKGQEIISDCDHDQEEGLNLGCGIEGELLSVEEREAEGEDVGTLRVEPNEDEALLPDEAPFLGAEEETTGDPTETLGT